MGKTALVVNPRSGAGATERRIEALHRAVEEHLGEHEIWLTEAVGHGIELAARAVAQGFDRVVAVGGDGTASEVVNGLMGGPGPGEVVFGVIPGGTGSDLVRSLGVPGGFDAAAAVLARARPRPLDVARVEVADPSGGSRVRWCINVCGFGANGEVVHRVNQGSKRWGGTATFLTATLAAIASYRSVEVEVSWVDAEDRPGTWRGPLMAAFVANGLYCGGGMWVARGGAMDDGLLDLTLVPDLGVARLLAAVPRLFTGTVDRVTGVLRTTVREIEARAITGSEVRVDVDGEQPGILPIRVVVQERVLLVAGEWADEAGAEE